MIKVGDEVMFANRCQSGPWPMKVQAVDTNMFDTMVKVNDRWWTPGCFEPYSEWATRNPNV